MKKRVLILAFLILTLLLVSCRFKPEAGEKPLETAAAIKIVTTGTQGLDTKFLPDYPPSFLYDTTELIAIAELWNKGKYDLEPGACFVELTGYDPNIIRGLYRQPCSPGTVLEGKETYNLDGGFEHVEFRSTNIMLPEGVFEYEPNLNLVACYAYQTFANPLVCVENSLYQVSSEQKNCYVQDVGMGGGQSAPIGVSYVDVEMAGDKAIFSINIVNYGSGRALSPLSSLSQCPHTLEYDDLDKVGYSVELSGGIPISCKPFDQIARLTNNQGKIICTFNIGNTPAYETPLMIRLSYNYMQSFTQPFKIIKTPGFE